ncbi:uncharacterized protein LOC124917624 [Impatiens glandulifera]|uniref:uncharacterized protein LOC124917624 n=1 Tax=Impatiens glandulifera TaxID=253017 RepID=UPI001FB19BA5|nr:uncharacterized protein LOC124917624 [Impatiens glandulifera]
MCSKKDTRRSARIKARSEIQNPKFLNLTLSISDSAAVAVPVVAADKMGSNSTDSPTHHPQLNLFPLRPTSDDVDNVEYLLNSAAVDGSATTLTSIFGAVSSSTSSSTSSEDNNNNSNNNNNNHNNHHDLLARTALRKKERDRCKEERWVCYSEVMSNTGGGSSVDVSGDDQMMMKKRHERRRKLALKLDYEEIMNTWGRPLIHIQLESPATVPDLMMKLDHNQYHHQSISSDHTGGEAAMGGWGHSNDGGLWRVPEVEKRWCSNNLADTLKIKEEVESGQHLREASMLRYKEKRQSRLFSKRIRYQVRKINAEKRPRIKGRFVKRS